LGIVFYEMLIGEPLEKSLGIEDFFNEPLSSKIEKLLVSVSLRLTKKSQDILRYLLNPVEDLRPTVSEALLFV
jgi:serine/threonine protein kinase